MNGGFGLLTSYRIYQNFACDRRLVVHTGDVAEFVKHLPDNSIKLIITSPPYNLGKRYETPVALHKYLDEQSSIIAELVRILAHDGSLCWQVGNYVQKPTWYFIMGPAVSQSLCLKEWGNIETKNFRGIALLHSACPVLKGKVMHWGPMYPW